MTNKRSPTRQTPPPMGAYANRNPASTLLTELKTRARLQINAARRAPDAPQPDLRLRDCLNQVAREAGYTNWEHGRRVLGGLAAPGEDMGTFWHAPGCNTLLNAWFADHEKAAVALAGMRCAFLLPYRRQFIVAGVDYIREIGLDVEDPAWAGARNDLVRAYGTEPWQMLAFKRLKAPRSTFAAR